MSVQDGRKILTGGDNSVTEFFATKTREPLSVKFLPIVTKAADGTTDLYGLMFQPTTLDPR